MRNDRLLEEGGWLYPVRRLPSVEAPRELCCLELGTQKRGSPIHATTVGQRPNEEGGGETRGREGGSGQQTEV